VISMEAKGGGMMKESNGLIVFTQWQVALESCLSE
jgi:hypothetical protein